MVVAVVTIAVLTAVYAAALYRGDGSPRLGASLAEPQADPEEVAGEQWVVAGEVRKVLGDDVITIGGPAFGISPLPVILRGRGRDAGDGRLSPGDVGQFVGVLRRLDVDALERRMRIDLPGERLRSLGEDLVLVADDAAVDRREP